MGSRSLPEQYNSNFYLDVDTHLYGFMFLKHFRLSRTPVTFGPFRGLALRHAASLSIFSCAFFGQAILVFSDFLSNTSCGTKRQARAREKVRAKKKTEKQQHSKKKKEKGKNFAKISRQCKISWIYADFLPNLQTILEICLLFKVIRKRFSRR